MKIKKPEIIPMFKCSSGTPVETLDLWKSSELETLFGKYSGSIENSTAETRAKTFKDLSAFLVEHAETLVPILWLKEKGRPNGAKDRKPRVKRTAETAAAKAE